MPLTEVDGYPPRLPRLSPGHVGRRGVADETAAHMVDARDNPVWLDGLGLPRLVTAPGCKSRQCGERNEAVGHSTHDAHTTRLAPNRQRQGSANRLGEHRSRLSLLASLVPRGSPAGRRRFAAQGLRLEVEMALDRGMRHLSGLAMQE